MAVDLKRAAFFVPSAQRFLHGELSVLTGCESFFTDLGGCTRFDRFFELIFRA